MGKRRRQWAGRSPDARTVISPDGWKLVLRSGSGAATLAGRHHAAFPAVQTSRTRRPPNVLYLMTDQQSHFAVARHADDRLDAPHHTVYGGKWHLPKGFTGMRGFEELIGWFMRWAR
jgi:hypothetical protein